MVEVIKRVMSSWSKAGYSLKIDPLKKIMNELQLRAVKNIKFSFDPYHPNIRSMRESLFLLKVPKVLKTNFNCSTKVDVRSDRCDPEIIVTFNDQKKLIFKTANLTTLDILEKLTDICDEKDPKKDEPVLTLTKGGKMKKK